MEITYGCQCTGPRCRVHDLNSPPTEEMNRSSQEVAALGFDPERSRKKQVAAAAPVAFRIARGDRVMVVCTRCDLRGDWHLERLFDKDTDFTVFEAYDDLGAALLRELVDDTHWEEFCQRHAPVLSSARAC